MRKRKRKSWAPAQSGRKIRFGLLRILNLKVNQIPKRFKSSNELNLNSKNPKQLLGARVHFIILKISIFSYSSYSSSEFCFLEKNCHR